MLRSYRTGRSGPGRASLDLLVDRLVDYQAPCSRARRRRAAATSPVLATRGLLRSSCRRSARRVAPRHRRVAETTPLTDERARGADGVLTTCAVAVAETGTIVLDAGADQGRRMLTLVPDQHIGVVRADQVVRRCPRRSPDSTRPVR